MVKEVEVTEDVELEVSSPGGHLGQRLPRLVAEDRRKDRLHVATSTHMFPQGPIVAVDRMAGAVVRPHDLTPSLDRDHPYAELD